MCQKKKLFDTYRSCNGCMIIVANDVACLVIRVGTMKIKMFFDEVVRVLRFARHVLNSMNNLFIYLFI